MNSYSNSSKERLKECHRDLQLIFSTVLQSWDHTILTGHRDREEQNKKFVSGLSQVQWPNSKHNSRPSIAVDVSPYPIPKNWGAGNRDEYEKFRYFAFYVLGVADILLQLGYIDHALRWGGDWNMNLDVSDQTFNDLVHFELTEEH